MSGLDCLIWYSVATLLSSTTLLGQRSASVEIRWGTYDEFLNSPCLPPEIKSISAIQHYLAYIMETSNINKTWLPIKRRDLDGWYWLSNEYQGKSLSISPGVTYGRDCGVLRAGEKILDDIECDRKFPKFLCQMPGSSCLSNATNCFVNDGITYTIFMNSSTWYEARTNCHKQGQQLANLPRASQQRLLEILQQKIVTFHDTWVGLRKKDYFIENQNMSVDSFYWNTANTCPCKSRNECVVLEKIKGSIFNWIPWNCSDLITYQKCNLKTTESGVLDVHLGTTQSSKCQTVTANVSTGTETAETCNDGFKVAFAMFLLLFLILLILILAVIFWKYRKGEIQLLNKHQTDKREAELDEIQVLNKQQTEKIEAESTPLTSKELPSKCFNLQHIKTQLSQVQDELSSLQENNRKMQLELNDKTEKLAAKTECLKSVSESLKLMEAKKTEAAQKQKSADEKIILLSKELKGAEKKIEDMNLEMMGLRAAHHAKCETLGKQLENNNILSDALTKEKEITNRLSKEVANKEQEMEDKEKTLSEIMKKLEKASQDKDVKKSALKIQVEDLTITKDAAQREALQLRQQVDLLKKETTKNAEMHNLKKKELEEQLQEARGFNQKMNELLENERKSNEKLMTSLKNGKATLQAELIATRKLLEEKNKTLELKEGELQQILQEKQKLEVSLQKKKEQQIRFEGEPHKAMQTNLAGDINIQQMTLQVTQLKKLLGIKDSTHETVLSCVEKLLEEKSDQYKQLRKALVQIAEKENLLKEKDKQLARTTFPVTKGGTGYLSK